MVTSVDNTLSVITKNERGHRQQRRPALIIVLEASRPWAGGARHFIDHVDVIELGRGTERIGRRTRDGDDDCLHLSIPDRWMSSQHTRIEHRFGRWLITDKNSKNGTAVNGTTIGTAVLKDGDVIGVGHTLLTFRLALEAADSEPQSLDCEQSPFPDRALATLCPPLGREFELAKRLANNADISFLIRGESGTGKEVLARSIHRHSGRSGSMVAVNCGAIPKTLIESELFGHVRGAFSGADRDRIGLIRSADNGTLLLDEIGDLALASQTALLRVLQEREVQPVGANQPFPIDVRVLSATHQDLEAMVATGQFRADLYARLAGYTITLVPLRERMDDLGVLIRSLWNQLASERTPAAATHPGLTFECAQRLLGYDWPLNIRELEGALRAGLALCGDQVLGVEHLPNAIRRNPNPPPPINPHSEKDAKLLAMLEPELRAHRGNISAVARALGKDRKQIQRWLKRLAIEASSYR